MNAHRLAEQPEEAERLLAHYFERTRDEQLLPLMPGVILERVAKEMVPEFVKGSIVRAGLFSWLFQGATANKITDAQRRDLQTAHELLQAIGPNDPVRVYQSAIASVGQSQFERAVQELRRAKELGHPYASGIDTTIDIIQKREKD